MGAKWKLSKKDIKRMRLVNIHDPRLCEGRGCVIHHWSKDNPLKHRPLLWRDDKGIFERVCEHGVGHDDFDDVAYRMSIADEKDKPYVGIHGCCGQRCCSSAPQDGVSHEDDEG
jgi:hypothetical protein